MRPTRRGYGALAVVVAALLFAWTSGPRALNAVATPALVAVVAGAVQVHRSGTPRVERTEPRRGFPGETRTVELTVDGRGVATITDDVGDGLSGSATFERTLPATVSYEVTYERRGVHTLDRTRVRIRDALGLVAAEYDIEETTTAVVFPHVYSVGDPGSVLGSLGPVSDERSEFDRLREYVPEDSLRDVHWKSSAKHGDLLVMEFTDPTTEDAVSIAAACTAGHVDEMATAAATVFVAVLRAGLAVDLTVPAGTLSRGDGEGHGQRALELLARTGSGDVPDRDWEAADVQVRADDAGVTVTVDEQVHSLDGLTVTRENPLLSEVVA